MLFFAFAILTGAAAAEELAVPSSLERNQPADFVYRFDNALSGRGSLSIEWSDVVGRVIERRRISLNLIDSREAVFSLDMRRAVTAGNQVIAHLSVDGMDRNSVNLRRESAVSASFIVPPVDHAWSDYQIIMWQGQTPAGYAALKKLGVTAGMVPANNRDQTSEPRSAHPCRSALLSRKHRDRFLFALP